MLSFFIVILTFSNRKSQRLLLELDISKQNNYNYLLHIFLYSLILSYYIALFTTFPCLSRSSHPEMVLRKGVLKICSKFTGEHPCQSAFSIKLQSNFIEITLRHGFSLVNLLHIFRTLFLKNTSGRLLLLVFPPRFITVIICHGSKIYITRSKIFFVN